MNVKKLSEKLKDFCIEANDLRIKHRKELLDNYNEFSIDLEKYGVYIKSFKENFDGDVIVELTNGQILNYIDEE